MHILNTLLLGLLKLPLKVRLLIVLLSFQLCFTLYFFSQFNGPLLAFPLALTVWLFERRSALICTILTDIALAGVITLSNHSFSWPRPLLLGFLTGTLALLTESLFICYLRYLLEVAETARLQVVKAKQQEHLLYEQQMHALQEKRKIANAYEQQKHLNQLKDRFIINVSHELRTPVQTMLGYLELLHSFDGRIDISVRTDSLKHALSTCQELQLLVNKVLDTVLIDSGKHSPKTEVLSVNQMVRDVLTLIEPEKLQKFTLHLDLPEHLMVLADAQYIRQVMLNLLVNALKYCSVPIPGSVIIRARHNTTASSSSSHISICVQDTGPGIPPEEIPFLFERFVRLKRDLAGSVHGTGLGLSISKELVESMGGQIWVESTGIPGEGSTFCFILPSATESAVTLL